MTLKWTILVLLEYQIIVTSPSITGVTYMDHFDFEERYRNVDECNPLHWHPLHLPAYCANIFEKLIRSRIASKTPVRLVREKEKHKNPDKKKHKTHSSAYHTQYEYPPGFYEFPFPIYQISSEYDEVYAQPYGEPLPPSPYEKMIELLKKDIMKGPSSPTVTVMPNIGPVALYNQAISKKSVNFIKKIAEAYVKATKKAYDDYYATYGNYYASEPHIYVYDSAKNNTKTEKKKPKKDKKEKAKKEKNDKDKIYRLKTKHGDVVTIIETKNAHLMKDDGPPLPPEWGNIQLPLPRLLIIALSLEGIQCSIDGSFSPRRPNDTKSSDNSCNPLYWYPRNIPDYCYINNSPNAPTPPGPDISIPIPVPVPVPPPPPIPMPIIPPPMVPPIMMPPSVVPPGPPPPIMVPNPIMPLPMPLPFGIPLAPTNPMVPVAGIPLPPLPIPYPQPLSLPFQQPYLSPYPGPYPAPYPPPYPSPFPSPYPIQSPGAGMVPGIPGLVSPDGGINIMPFSDAYADMLEKHKQKMIRRRLQKLLNEYDKYPYKSRRKTRRNNGVEETREKPEDTNSIVE